MDRRQLKSQQRLMAALARLLTNGHPIQSVTIQQIVREANVARSTFYRNFDSKTDFLGWVSSQIEDGIIKAVKINDAVITPHPFQNYFRYLDQQRVFIKAFLETLSWPDLVSRMYADATAVYRQELQGKQHRLSADDLATYIVGAHVQITRAWLAADHPRPPVEMAELLTTLTRDGLLKGFGIDHIISLPR